MKCQNCGENEANVRYTEIINGVKKEMALCDKCSKELGMQSLDFNIPINFSSFLGEFLEDSDNLLPNFIDKHELKCDFCGMTFDDFVSCGKLGCANCYNVFENKINNILKNLHGSNMHLGRRYLSDNKDTKNEKHIVENNKKVETNVGARNARPDEEKTVKTKLQKLKDDLRKAIKDERYEDAAKIRDEIKKMEE